jgi:malonate decarboxylase gamma subunit
MSAEAGKRGRAWFSALSGASGPMPGDPASVLVADAPLGADTARFLCVVPDPRGRFPRARQGEVGLEEAYALASRVREAIALDSSGARRPIVAIVDVKSQAYGRCEETAGIYLAAAAAVDAYATARLAGHPVIALVVGHAISGGFLTHGHQANRILAFDDPGVTIHAMHKEAAAAVTRRSVHELETLGRQIAPLSYDIRDYAQLGLLHKLLHVEHPDRPEPPEITIVREALTEAIADARKGPRDLSHLLDAAQALRQASILVRCKLEEQWTEGPTAREGP